MTGRLLTAREVAGLLGVTPETVLRWIDTRGLPARRLTSRAMRFNEAELDAWLAERSTAGDADRDAPATRRAARQGGAYGSVCSVAPATSPRNGGDDRED